MDVDRRKCDGENNSSSVPNQRSYIGSLPPPLLFGHVPPVATKNALSFMVMGLTVLIYGAVAQKYPVACLGAAVSLLSIVYIREYHGLPRYHRQAQFHVRHEQIT